MRVATLCIVACLVTSASVASSEPNPPADAVSVAVKTPPTQAPEPAQVPSSEPEPRADAAAVASEPPKRAPPSKAELCETAVLAAQINNLPASFFTRLIRQESGFDPHVVSRAGAQGIAQFMPRTASLRGLADPFEPVGALAASAKFLAELVGQFGNLGLAAAAYNAGPKRVQDWIARRGKLPAETRHYVLSITGRVAEAWAGVRMRNEQAQLASAGGCLTVARNEAPVVTSPQVEARAEPPRPVMAAAAERRSLPQPSRFIVGRPVPAAVKASEARVLARMKATLAKRRHGIVRVAALR